MKKTDESATKSQPQIHALPSLPELLHHELRQFVHLQGMKALALLLEEEREVLCGPAYARDGQRAAWRAGSSMGELILGGRRVQVRKPRVRDADGEVSLPSWNDFAEHDPLDARALEQMVLGVSTRKYGRSLEDVPTSMKTRGESRSAVSRRFKAATEKQMKELLHRDLGELNLLALMIDGIHIDDHLILIALGIAEDGSKHVLGLWEGATENQSVCLRMLENLLARNLDAQRSYLFVIDGSKALRSGIARVFGKRAMVQRCQVHKRRNVLGHLPKELHMSIGKGMRDAYTSKSKATAKKRLLALASQLSQQHPGGAASIREGLDETLTLKDMGLNKSLERTLSNTNMIENLNGGIRDITRRVKQWRGGSMINRWVAAAALEREKSFRRVVGYRDLAKLAAELQKNDRQIEQSLASEAMAS